MKRCPDEAWTFLPLCVIHQDWQACSHLKFPGLCPEVVWGWHCLAGRQMGVGWGYLQGLCIQIPPQSLNQCTAQDSLEVAMQLMLVCGSPASVSRVGIRGNVPSSSWLLGLMCLIEKYGPGFLWVWRVLRQTQLVEDFLLFLPSPFETWFYCMAGLKLAGICLPLLLLPECWD